MSTFRIGSHLLCAALVLTGALTVHADEDESPSVLRTIFDQSVLYSPILDFPQTIGAGGNVVNGRLNFGLDTNNAILADRTPALFVGTSQLAGQVTSNGKVCASCHLPSVGWGLPGTHVDSFFPPNDPVFDTSAESGTDPLGVSLFHEHSLVEVRPGRFNPLRPESDPFRRVISWRKSQHLINVALTFGILNDGRQRNLVEQARAAVFFHTQGGDTRFDDIANAPNLSSQRLKDISAFEETIIDPPELKALLNPSDPLYPVLSTDPFYTVNATTPAQLRGESVFMRDCLSCHNTPNVFGNRDHVNGPPLNTPLNYGHVFDVGVGQRNALHLDVRPYNPTTHGRDPHVVLPLVAVDGRVVNYTVKDDIGAAAATGRLEDLYRFKVPQLRRISRLAPYFHDNSVDTLEDVVDYFNSDWYNDSADGQQHPIHESKKERNDLVEFLKIL
jgi:hypothetical protein